MDDQTIRKAIELQKKRDGLFSLINKIYNYFGSRWGDLSFEDYKTAIEKLDKDELKTVKNIIENRLRIEANKVNKELEEL